MPSDIRLAGTFFIRKHKGDSTDMKYDDEQRINADAVIHILADMIYEYMVNEEKQKKEMLDKKQPAVVEDEQSSET